jgi:hypothetical protein
MVAICAAVRNLSGKVAQYLILFCNLQKQERTERTKYGENVWNFSLETKEVLFPLRLAELLLYDLRKRSWKDLGSEEQESVGSFKLSRLADST